MQSIEFVSQDLLAVGYGTFQYNDEKEGWNEFVCSLKNEFFS